MGAMARIIVLMALLAVACASGSGSTRALHGGVGNQCRSVKVHRLDGTSSILDGDVSLKITGLPGCKVDILAMGPNLGDGRVPGVISDTATTSLGLRTCSRLPR